jgi:large subunit ribosomal protein L13
MKTYMPKREEIDRKWYVADLKDVVLGRAAVKVAQLLRGKNKPYFSPHLDCGDHIILVNARHVRVTGRKETDKKYYRYTGYPGGLRETDLQHMLAKQPERVVEKAVRGMIPHNRLGRKMFKKLHVYADDSHPHRAQKPETLKL